MSSIAELVEMLKDGNISKEQMLEMIYSQSFPSKQEHITTADISQGGTLIVDSNRDYDFEFSPKNFEDFHKKQGISFEPSFSGQIHDEFVDRQAQWEVRKKIYQEALRKQKNMLETQECTFHPRTNVGKSNFSQETVERLSKKKEDSRYDYIRQEQERKKLEEEIRECTFQPEINRNSCISGSRYWSNTPKKTFNIDEPVFAPKVRGPSKHMKAANEYVKQDPFERLAKPKPIEIANTSVERPRNLSVKTPDYYGCSFSSRPFYERQALYELMKYEKREALEQEIPERPVMNERSKKLVKTSFYERNDDMIEKKKHQKSEDLGSFQPKITALGKMSRIRSFKEMSYEDAKKKNKKIESLREQGEEKIREITTPAPYNSKSYSNIKSKLQILDDPYSYVDRLKVQQRKKELEAQIFKEEKIREETMECTHSPAIIDAPEYVKQIARNMALIKSESTVNKKPPRPEWR